MPLLITMLNPDFLGAESFTDAFYSALQNTHHSISTFYVDHETLPDGHKVPNISWNGNDYSDGQVFQKMWEDSMPYTYYDIQTVDSHMINRNFVAEGGRRARDKNKTMSMVVIVNGAVRLFEKKDGPLRQFSETFTLVPNVENGKKRHQWLIQMQNFRYVI